jgi:peptidoglycan/xylan/chitin deacetylase (PgdA/CDA1 family)
MWGVRDVVTIDTYGQHIRGVHTALPELLRYFKKYHINGTFAAVGLLFFENKEELMNNLPAVKPNYNDPNLSPYGDYIDKFVGSDTASDPYHYGPRLIELIKNTPGQEIATHTFCHYYCLEPGQTLDDFKHDLQSAISIAKKRGITIETIIFPRNQVNEKYLEVCREHGIKSYRHNEESWLYTARNNENERLLRRSLRLVDAYFNISGHHCYTDSCMSASFPYSMPSSRFLRPYSSRLKWLEGLRLHRITEGMTHAAKNNLTYHLWWHPHNFGINQDKNFAFLEKILIHYTHLNEKYSFTSLNMSELSKRLYESAGK